MASIKKPGSNETGFKFCTKHFYTFKLLLIFSTNTLDGLKLGT